MVDRTWSINGGDIKGALEALAATRRPAALVRVEVDAASLRRARANGLSSDLEGALLQEAWLAVTEMLPRSTAGLRYAWSRFDFVVEGAKPTLSALGRHVLRALKEVDGSTAIHWHVVFTELLDGNAERTLRCDPGYDLRSVENKTVIAWARPYDGDDWREPQRYPTVTFFAVEE